MVDEESHEIAAEPGGAPPNRDPRPTDTVIEGEVAQNPEAPAPEPPPPSAAPDEPAPAPPAAPRVALRALVAGAIAGAIVSAVAAALFTLLPPKAGLSEADANRLSGLETTVSQENAAIAGLDKRIGALEGVHTAAALTALDKRVGAVETSAAQSGVGGLDKRLGALEAANAADGQKTASEADAVQNLSGDLRTLRADVDAARGEIPGLASRVAKLESATSSGDLSSVEGRVGKLESALSGSKAETRAAPEAPAPRDNPAALAIVAQTISDKLASGAPFEAEVDALGTLGVDPQKLQPLKAVAGGAPTDRALATSFEAVEPKIFAAIAPPEPSGIADRFLAHLRSLVEIRRTGETAGDDPQALASQIVARVGRGDFDGALASFGKLPEAARSAASAWAAETQAKRSAVAAAQSICETAVTQIVKPAKP
jgi:hypothetical protein